MIALIIIVFLLMVFLWWKGYISLSQKKEKFSPPGGIIVNVARSRA